jgi:ADP-ribosylglycohydrolase
VRALKRPPDLRARVVGSIVGLAVGDALGYPHEFRTVEQVRRELAPEGITDFVALKDPRFSRPVILGPDHPPGTFTDDTQMSLCVADALIAHGARAGEAPEVLFDDMAKRFVDWYFSDDNNRSPGAATGTACERLKEGTSWRESGVLDSKGAGANMRVVPVGLFFSDLDVVANVARLQADITHRHPAALEAAAATAAATAMLLDDVPLPILLDEVRRLVGGRVPDFDELSHRFELSVLEDPSEVLIERDASEVALGEAWVAEEAFFAALYCVWRAPTSFEDAVLLAVNTDGDSDTIATIVGGFMGAKLGLDAIPERWRAGVEKSALLHDVGARLFEARPATARSSPT